MRSKSGYTGVYANKYGTINIKFAVGKRDNPKYYQWTLDLPQTPTGYREAFATREQRRQRVLNGLPPLEEAFENPTVFHAAELWRAHVIAENRIAQRTIDGYIGHLNRYWLPRIADVQVRNLRFAVLRDIIDQCQFGRQKTRTNVITAIRVLLRFCHESDWIDHNPASKFDTRIKPDERSKPVAYTAEQRDEILKWLREHAPEKVALYFTLAFATGLRTGEILALQWGDIDADGLEIERAVSRGEVKGTKTNETRFVPVVPSLRRVLLTYRRAEMQQGNHTGQVFKNQYGRMYTRSDKINPWFHRACRETGVIDLMGRHSPYPWRHTWVTEAYNADLDPWTVADIAGHSVQTARKHYRAHTKRSRLIDAVKKMS